MKKPTITELLSLAMCYGSLAAAWAVYGWELAVILFVLIWSHNLDVKASCE